jgi:hypothetical protein
MAEKPNSIIGIQERNESLSGAINWIKQEKM